MRSIVLLSGGLDSAVNLAQAAAETEVKLCLTFNYGQRAANREIRASSALAAHYGSAHRIIELPFLAEITKTSLVDLSQEVPSLEQDQLDNMDIISGTAAKVWVPNRNGLFINIAASFAESYDCSLILTGFNAEEAVTFPDNSPAFIQAANSSLSFSTLNQVKVKSYTQDLNKEQIAALGKSLGLPFEHVWSCYFGGEEMCGQCESCQRFKRALENSEY